MLPQDCFNNIKPPVTPPPPPQLYTTGVLLNRMILYLHTLKPSDNCFFLINSDIQELIHDIHCFK